MAFALERVRIVKFQDADLADKRAGDAHLAVLADLKRAAAHIDEATSGVLNPVAA